MILFKPLVPLLLRHTYTNKTDRQHRKRGRQSTHICMSMCARTHTHTPGLPMTNRLRVFDTLELNSSPLSFPCAWNWPSKLASEGCVYFLKFSTVRRPEKVGTVSPSSDTCTTHMTLVKVPCCQLSYIPYVFKHCDLLVLKIMILWETVCITLYSQNLSLPSWLVKD